MRGKAAALIGLVGLACAPARASAAPPRVTSINQCTDQLVLALVPRERIASVTWLARDPAYSLMARAAARVPTNRGTAEEVLRDHPGLVLASSFGGGSTKALLAHAGVPVAEIADPQSLDDIRQAVSAAAGAVGEVARGRAWLERMDRNLAWLARTPRPTVRVAVWDGGGIGAPPGSLGRLLLTLAGADVVGEGRGGGVERLLALRPALLLTSSPAGQSAALRDGVAAHPLVRRFWAGRTLALSPASSICGTPGLVDAAVALRRKLLRLAPALRVPPAIGATRA